MCSPPCTDSAETLVEKVARRMAQKHAFLRSRGRMGSAITSFKDWATLVQQQLFSDSEIKFFWTIVAVGYYCASYGEFICTKFEISLQPQEKISISVVPRHIARNPTI